MHDEFESPVDLHENTVVIGGHPLRWTSIAIASGALLLALFNATTINAWAEDLPPGPATALLIGASEDWLALTDRAGLGRPRAEMRRVWEAAEAARFGKEEGTTP